MIATLGLIFSVFILIFGILSLAGTGSIFNQFDGSIPFISGSIGMTPVLWILISMTTLMEHSSAQPVE